MRLLCALLAALLAVGRHQVAAGSNGFLRTLLASRYAEPEPNTIMSGVGRNGKPVAAFPLGLCQGDCDSDDDCSDGLLCFMDENYDTVPGCIGIRGVSPNGHKEDYCYQPFTSMPVPRPIPRPTPQPFMADMVCDLEGASVIGQTELEVENRIYQIQGNETTSPFVDSMVYRVHGIVTAISGNRFFMQDVEGDFDPATSDAIQVQSDNAATDPIMGVYMGNTTELNVGDTVIISEGAIEEYIPPGPRFSQPTTLLHALSVNTFVQTRGNARPAPVLIGIEGFSPPTENMQDGVDFWESLEAMLVEVVNPVGISTSKDNRVWVVSEFTRNATGISERCTLNVNETDFNPERIQIYETGVFDAAFPNGQDVGVEYDNVFGVVGYFDGNYAIYPIEHFGVSKDFKLTDTSTNCKKDYDTMLVGTYNIDESLNYETLSKQIVSNMGFPDILALQGIPDGFNLPLLIEYITNVTADAPNTYRYVMPWPMNISLAILYNPWRVSQYNMTIETGSDPNYLVAKFKFLPLQEKFDVINTIWTDKDGSAAIMGVNQPFDQLQNVSLINAGVQERLDESNVIRKLIEGDDKFVTDPERVVVLGSFFENEFVSPTVNLEGVPLLNLANKVRDKERYSVIDFGNSQAWDSIYISQFFACSSSVGDYIHVNVEFFEGISDHDPMIGCLTLPFDEDSSSGGNSR